MKDCFDILDEEDKRELEKLREKLQDVLEKNLEEELKLKKKVAKFCLKIIDKTVLEEEEITNTCYILTGAFIWYEFKDQLDEAFSIAGDLELPEENFEGDKKELFERMTEIFKDYLG